MKQSFFALLFLLGLFSCKKPNDPNPAPATDAYCTAGTRVESVNDNNVPEDIKNMVYGIWPGYYSNSVGTRKVLIIPFQGATQNQWNPGVTHEKIRSVFFGGQTIASLNMRQYLRTNSYNQFDIEEAEIAGLVTLPLDKMDYANADTSFGGDWTRNNNLTRDILLNANINWPAYDRDNNGTISTNELQIVFLMAEQVLTGACRPATVSANTQAGNYTFNNGFVYITTKQASDPDPSTHPIAGPGVMIHEMLHGLFNLPDRYASQNASGSTGAYDIMSNSYNLVHMNMYDKIKLGWVRPKILKLDGNTASTCYEIAASASAPSALVLYKPSAPREFWVIEYRSPIASVYDVNIWEAGLAVWWVDAYEQDEKKKLKLVNSQMPTTPPDSISYNANVSGALFRYTDAQAGNNKEYLLRSRTGTANILLRSVSLPLDNRMYFEL